MKTRIILINIIILFWGIPEFLKAQGAGSALDFDGTDDYIAVVEALSGWSKKKPITINGSSSGLTNYQVQLTVNYDADMQSDYDDLRFKDLNDNNLNYWIEDYDASSATIWVNIPSIPSSGTTIYMYYGNSGASGASDGDSTFIFFDNFNDGNYNGWTVQAKSWVVENGILKDDAGGAMITITSPSNDPTGRAIRSKLRMTGDWKYPKMMIGWQNSNNFYQVFTDAAQDWLKINKAVNGSGTLLDTDNDTISKYTWYRWEVRWPSSSELSAEMWYMNGNSKASVSNSSNLENWTTGDYGFANYRGAKVTWFDDVAVRKYTTPEPSASVGSEVDANALDFGANQDFTITAWIKIPSSPGNVTIVSKMNDWYSGSNAGPGWAVVHATAHSDDLSFYIADVNNTGSATNGSSNSTVTGGNWHHIAVVADRSSSQTATFYIDGQQDGSFGISGESGDLSNDYPLLIGANYDKGNYDKYLRDRIEEVRIWSTALSQSGIRNNMCKTLSGSESGLEGYWKFDDGSGTTATDYAGSNDGTLYNFALSGSSSNWITSGAALGDYSEVLYTGSWSGKTVTLIESSVDTFTIANIDNSSSPPDGIHVYRVDAAPNNTTAPGNLETLSSQYYWGVYIIGGSGLSYDITYDYDEHPGYFNEDKLGIASRNDPTNSWTEETTVSSDTLKHELTITGNSSVQKEFILGTQSTNDPLPVELHSFTGEKVNDGIRLVWNTASEKNSRHFVIQRSPDGKRFQDIETIPAAGSSIEKTRYAYLDRDPEPGPNYYRLKQADLDGTVGYSRVIFVHNNSTIPWEIKVLGNPAGNKLICTVQSPVPSKCIFNLIDQYGNRVRSRKLHLITGHSILNFDLKGLKSGVYFLIVQQPGKNQVKRIVIE